MEQRFFVKICRMVILPDGEKRQDDLCYVYDVTPSSMSLMIKDIGRSFCHVYEKGKAHVLVIHD